MEVRRVEIGVTGRRPLLDGERLRVRGRAVAEEARTREAHDATTRKPVVVGEAEAALAVPHDQPPVERAQLVTLEVEQVPMGVRG